MKPMSETGPREVTATVLRGVIEELRDRGIYDEVRARVPLPVGQAMDKPGVMMLTWHRATVTDAIFETAAALRGREAVRAMGFSMMTGRGIGSLLRPLLDMWLKVSNSGPEALFSRLDAASTVLMRGTTFGWIRRGDGAGTVTFACEDFAPDANWAFWEGVLQYAFVLTHVEGNIGQARLTDGGRQCEIDAEWKSGHARC
jgi:hypothetical protein